MHGSLRVGGIFLVFIALSGCRPAAPVSSDPPQPTSETTIPATSAPVAAVDSTSLEPTAPKTVDEAPAQPPAQTNANTPPMPEPTTVAVAPTIEPPKTLANPSGTTLGGKAPAANDGLLLRYGDDPDTLNLINGNDSVSTAFQRWVYEGMFEQDFHDPTKYNPALATHYEFDEKTLEYTIHLRKGVKWHPITLPKTGKILEGKEFTSRDVKFTIDCILNPLTEAASLRSYYVDPEAKEDSEKIRIEVSTPDKYTVKFRWKKPYFLHKSFTLEIGIMPRHVYSVDEEGNPISLDFSSKEFAEGFNNHWANRQMCGTGPLQFQEWIRDRKLLLVRNPDYWGRPFYFDRVTFENISNTQIAVQDALNNRLDWVPIPEKDMYFQMKNEPAVKSGKARLREFDFPGYRYIGYNLEKELFKDVRVRTALSHSVPIDQIIETVFLGLAIPCNGPFQMGSPGNDKSIQPLKFDLELAGKLLDEAGWVDSDMDGLRDKVVNGTKVDASYTMMMFSESPSFQRIGTIVQENQRKIGVKVILEPTKWSLMLQRLQKKEFGATMLGWSMSWQQDPYQIWHGSQASAPDSSNAISYRNPEVDRLIDALRIEINEAKQVELYHQIHRLIFQDQPYTFLFSEKQTVIHDGRLENINFYLIRPAYDAREWFSSRARPLAQ